jgi:hypothetical protein
VKVGFGDRLNPTEDAYHNWLQERDTDVGEYCIQEASEFLLWSSFDSLRQLGPCLQLEI